MTWRRLQESPVGFEVRIEVGFAALVYGQAPRLGTDVGASAFPVGSVPPDKAAEDFCTHKDEQSGVDEVPEVHC